MPTLTAVRCHGPDTIGIGGRALPGGASVSTVSAGLHMRIEAHSLSFLILASALTNLHQWQQERRQPGPGGEVGYVRAQEGEDLEPRQPATPSLRSMTTT